MLPFIRFGTYLLWGWIVTFCILINNFHPIIPVLIWFVTYDRSGSGYGTWLFVPELIVPWTVVIFLSCYIKKLNAYFLPWITSRISTVVYSGKRCGYNSGAVSYGSDDSDPWINLEHLILSNIPTWFFFVFSFSIVLTNENCIYM